MCDDFVTSKEKRKGMILLKETLLKQNNEMKVIINKLNEMMFLNIKKECI
ncbi:hypothetical protein CNEO4_260050 [Clostridium neonatale]|nr:hypothetical protein CNEO4_260050 [Clostridium neonatale]